MLKIKQPAVGSGQLQPPSGQNPEEVAVTEEEDAAVDRSQPGDHAIGPVADRRDRLAAGSSHRERATSPGCSLADLGGRQPS